MRTLLLTVCVTLFAVTSPLSAVAQARALIPPGTGLTITFTPIEPGSRMNRAIGDAQIDLGNIVGTPEQTRGSATIVRRDVAIRLDDADRAGSARLSAWLQVDDHRSRVRINGRLLSELPSIIDPAAFIGVAVRYVIEIEVPHAEPAGPLVSRILWRAER